MTTLRRSRDRFVLATLVWALAGLSLFLAHRNDAQPLPKSLADLHRIVRDERILKAVPAVEVQGDGVVALTFETMVATPAGRVSVGQLNPDASLETPFFRSDAREDLKSPSTSHRLTFKLEPLEGPQNPAEEKRRLEGDVYYRLEIFDPRSDGAKYFQSRFHYSRVAGHYEKTTTILYGPFVDQVVGTSAVISWNTDRPSRGVVELFSKDSTAPLQSFLGAPTPSTDHRIKVTGLDAGQAYRYRVLVFDANVEKPVDSSARFLFHAAPQKNQKFEFAFMSDGRPPLGGGLSNFGGVNARVTQALLVDSYQRGANLILFGGDLTAGYTSSVTHFDMLLNMWKTIAEPVGHLIPIYEGFGNHESLQEFFTDAAGRLYHRDRTGAESAESEFDRHFANPDHDFPAPEVRNGVTGPSYRGTTYSFDYGNSHFIVLNMDYWFNGGGPLNDPALAWNLLGGNREGYIMDHQMAWLAKDLAAAQKRGAQHIFICGHDMPFPDSGHLKDAMWWNGLNDPSIPSGGVVAMRNRFMKLVNDYHVTALLFGHEHNYSRTVVDHAVDAAMTHPVTQFISGGAGAPFYPQNVKVPWASAVKKFAMVNHYILFTIEGSQVRFSAIAVDGKVFDTGTLP